MREADTEGGRYGKKGRDTESVGGRSTGGLCIDREAKLQLYLVRKT